MWNLTVGETLHLIVFGSFLLIAVIGYLGSYRFERIKRDVEQTKKWINAESDKTVQLTRLQFEMESQNYSAIWEKLIEVRNKALDLVSASGTIATEEYQIMKKEKLLDSFFKAWIDFRESMDKNQPFYDPGNFEKLDNLIGEKLIRDGNQMVKLTPKNIEDAEQNSKEIVTGINEFFETIHKKMAKETVSAGLQVAV